METYNLVRDYDWTSIPRGTGMRNVAPRVYLKSYKINSSETLNRIQGYVNVAAAQDAEEFYDKMYGEISEEEDIFWIPFFGDMVRSFSNEYGDTFQAAFLGTIDSALQVAGGEFGTFASYKPVENLGKAVGNIISAADEAYSKLGYGEGIKEAVKSFGDLTAGMSTHPGSYIETPKMYQYTQNDSGLEISFPIFNTVNSDYSKNTELVEHLTRINRPKRINGIVMEPPRIYEVKLKGIRYIRWAYCSNFSVSLLGARRIIEGKIIPEGYLINMTMTSLTTEVSNFMDKIM